MEGVGHPGQQVGGAGAVGGDAHAGRAGDAGEAVGHERGGLLVAGGQELDVVAAVHAVEDLEHARTDDADYLADAELRQDFGHGVSRGHLHGVFSSRMFGARSTATMVLGTVKEPSEQHKRCL